MSNSAERVRDPQIAIPIDHSDKLLVERASEHERLSLASWVRMIIVREARKILGETEQRGA